MTDFISIDPGKTGAVVYWLDGRPDDWHQFRANVKGQRFFTYEDLNECTAFDFDVPVVIEALRDFGTGHQSISRNNTTAANWGALYGICLWYGCTVEIVTAAAWKRRLELGPDKQLSLDMARDLFPMCADSLKFKKNHDLAEALLIGHDYLLRNNND